MSPIGKKLQRPGPGGGWKRLRENIGNKGISNRVIVPIPSTPQGQKWSLDGGMEVRDQYTISPSSNLRSIVENFNIPLYQAWTFRKDSDVVSVPAGGGSVALPVGGGDQVVFDMDKFKGYGSVAYDETPYVPVSPFAFFYASGLSDISGGQRISSLLTVDMRMQPGSIAQTRYRGVFATDSNGNGVAWCLKGDNTILMLQVNAWVPNITTPTSTSVAMPGFKRIRMSLGKTFVSGGHGLTENLAINGSYYLDDVEIVFPTSTQVATPLIGNLENYGMCFANAGQGQQEIISDWIAIEGV